MDELLPCPFCGSKEVDVDLHDRAYCDACGVQGGECSGETEARALWNARASIGTIDHLRAIMAIVSVERGVEITVEDCDGGEVAFGVQRDGKRILWVHDPLTKALIYLFEGLSELTGGGSDA